MSRWLRRIDPLEPIIAATCRRKRSVTARSNATAPDRLEVARRRQSADAAGRGRGRSDRDDAVLHPGHGSAARPRHTLKHGDTFAVFDSHGDIGASAGGPDGLFNHDTRFCRGSNC